ncbi:hypothetical protein [Bacteriophage sp.]|nr:hypothetical protein [Bacteriophage sp.]
MSGSKVWTMVDMMRDTIREHGLAWAVDYYSRRMPRWEFRVFMRAAYL